MEYTVIYSAWVQSTIEPMEYKAENLILAAGSFCVPVNALLAAQIEDHSKVRVIILESERDGVDTKSTIARCKEETENSLAGKNCEIEFIVISSPFSASKDNMGKIYMELIDKPIEDSTIIADVTYGPKYIPMLIFCLLSYAERFLGCEIANVIYGQVYFNKDKKPYNPQIFDVAPVYLLSSFGRFFGNSKEEYDNFLKGFFR